MLIRRRASSVRVLAIWCLLYGVNVAGAGAQTTWSLPAPWSAQDVGSPTIAGTSSFDQGTFTITASGADIWGLSDQFHFVYQQVSGDVDVIARVDSVAMAHAWSKAGVMIRASLAPDAAHGFALVSAGRGAAFQRRTLDSGSSTSTAGPLVTPPEWVRLMRIGTRVTAYASTDGTTWSTIGSSTIALGDVAYVGLATTSHNVDAATTAAISSVAVVPLSLPASQRVLDIGAPAVPGSVMYRDGVYTHHAGGTDIWGSADQFSFVYQAVSGDVEVVARVKSINYTSSWAKAGVMIREDLTPGSRHALALVSAGRGAAFQRRIDPNGLSLHTPGPASPAPGWVRLVRTGSRIEAFWSADGTAWTPIGSEAIPMADAVYVGIATTSHSATAATDGVIDSLVITQAASALNQPPQIAITGPADGTTFALGTNVPVTAAASDADGTISRVDFLAGSTPIGSAASNPYSTTWSPSAPGTYSLTAVATDNTGATTSSRAVSVKIDPAPNQPPTVTLTAPADGATYTAPATVGLSASASDPENALARVEFYTGATLLGAATAAPYAFTWSSVPAGTYSVRAVAYDAAGASTSSATATITVAAPVVAPPTGVVFQASVDHATSVTSYELRVYASGANPSMATPTATSDLGKPTPDVNGDITVDRATFFSSLPAGNYVAAVAAIGTGGTSISTGVSFTR